MKIASYLDDVADRIRRTVPREKLPDDATEAEVDQLFRLYALVALLRGSSVTAADVHHAWSTWMLNRGCLHKCIVPFDSLDHEAQEQDEPFVSAIRAALGG